MLCLDPLAHRGLCVEPFHLALQTWVAVRKGWADVSALPWAGLTLSFKMAVAGVQRQCIQDWCGVHLRLFSPQKKASSRPPPPTGEIPMKHLWWPQPGYQFQARNWGRIYEVRALNLSQETSGQWQGPGFSALQKRIPTKMGSTETGVC